MTDYGCDSSTVQPDYTQDPDETSDYSFNFAAKLGTDTIATVTFVLPDGMTSVSESNDDTTATIFVSGGSTGGVYRVTCRVTTAGGRTWDQTYRILIEEH